MPRIVVRMNPCGLFGPGARMRAMIPATNPMMMIHKICTAMLLCFVRALARSTAAQGHCRRLAAKREADLRHDPVPRFRLTFRILQEDALHVAAPRTRKIAAAIEYGSVARARNREEPAGHPAVVEDARRDHQKPPQVLLRAAALFVRQHVDHEL